MFICVSDALANPLQWGHNGHDSISNSWRLHCLIVGSGANLKKKTSKLRVTGFCAGIHQWPVNSPHKKPVTRKLLPLDDVIMHFDAHQTICSTALLYDRLTLCICIFFYNYRICHEGPFITLMKEWTIMKNKLGTFNTNTIFTFM